jgi:hypothetical protein
MTSPSSEASVVAVEWRVPGEPVVFSGIALISVGWNTGRRLKRLSPTTARLRRSWSRAADRALDEAVTMAPIDRASSYNTVSRTATGRRQRRGSRRTRR